MKPKNLQNCKPRPEWKPPVWRVRGRVKFDAFDGYDKDGAERFALYTAELSSKGLRIHREWARRANDKVWPLEALVNGVSRSGQMELLLAKGKP